MVAIAENAGQAWAGLLSDLLEHGSPVSPRGQGTREILGHRIFFEDLRANVIEHHARGLNYRFMVAEWLWISFGYDILEPLVRYNPVMARFSDDGARLAGAYGPRVVPQIPYVLNCLRSDASSRQAVLTIWQPSPGPSKDVPCTIALQFLLRGDRLHLVATMRSSDAWMGVPYDVFSFSMIANAIAGELDVETGSLTLQMGSSHLYDSNAAAAREVLDSVVNVRAVRSPALPGWPSAGLEETLIGRTAVHNPVHPTEEAYRKVLLARTSADAIRHLEQAELEAIR